MIYARNAKHDVPALNQFRANTRRQDNQHNDIQHNDTGIKDLFVALNINSTQHKRHSA